MSTTSPNKAILLIGASRGLGCAMASLQASPMGLPVYERIGFEQVADYRTYVPVSG